MPGPTTHHDERSGLFLALAGFTLLSLGDVVVKSMVADWPPTAIAALRYTFGAAGLSALLLASEGRGSFRFAHPRLQLIRGFSIAVATAGFFGSLFLMPLAEATAIGFVSPIITALLAPLVLGERATRATWIASVAAFLGVLIILRPNVAELGIAALLPLASAAAMSVLMMANRAAAGRASAVAMQANLAMVAAPILVAFAALGHLSGAQALAVEMPSFEVVGKCAVVAVTASSGHWLIFLGTTRAGAATVSPMTYVQLVVAVTLGWVVFADRPDAESLLGAAIIVGAGLYLWSAKSRG